MKDIITTQRSDKEEKTELLKIAHSKIQETVEYVM